MNTVPHVKPKLIDIEITEPVNSENLARSEFTRVYAVNIVFTEVDFAQCVFNECYFRNCTFIRCDFTGSAFKASNLRGSQFDGCKFEYSSWERTLVDDSFLSRYLPSQVNLARDLARLLRVNFTQIGNYEAVNKAAAKEVRLTGIHLHKAAYSAEAYYRSKYKGWTRLQMGLLHAKWKVLELLWGNGESPFRVIGSGAFVIVCGIFISHAFLEARPLSDDIRAVGFGFWGLSSGVSLNSGLGLGLTLARLMLFGLFMAILVKKLSRR